jgi:hypothetical protein
LFFVAEKIAFVELKGEFEACFFVVSSKRYLLASVHWSIRRKWDTSRNYFTVKRISFFLLCRVEGKREAEE